jgi:DNA-binding transcriptional ArsR family regulator
MQMFEWNDLEGSDVAGTKAEVGAEPTAGLDTCAHRMVDPDRVASVRRSLIDLDEAERLAALFRLLGDRSRTRILFALAEAGELCVCDLAAAVDVPEASVSQALRLLRTAGIVRARRAGRMVWYHLDDGHVALLLDLSREHLRHGGR